MSEIFTVGQKIVYPSQGVGTVGALEDRDFNGKRISYYVIHIEASDMTIKVPVERAAGLGIRATVSPGEAAGALELMGEAFEPNPTDWKLRYQMNLDLLKKGSVADIARIVRSLYHRSKVKELPILEKKLYDNAQILLQSELAIALDKPKKEIGDLIHEYLEKQTAGKAQVSPPAGDPDLGEDPDVPDVDIREDESAEE